MQINWDPNKRAEYDATLESEADTYEKLKTSVFCMWKDNFFSFYTEEFTWYISSDSCLLGSRILGGSKSWEYFTPRSMFNLPSLACKFI